MTERGFPLRTKLFSSLQGQLQLATILTLFVGFTAASCASLWLDQRNLAVREKQLLHEQSYAIDSCIGTLLQGGASGDNAQANGENNILTACLQGRHDSTSVFVIKQPDGRLILPDPSSRYVPDTTVKALLKTPGQLFAGRSDVTLLHHGTYFLLHQHQYDGAGPRLIAIQNLTERSRSYTGTLVAFAVVWGALLLLTSIAVTVFVRRAVAPLRSLTSMASAITAENLPNSPLLLKNAPREVMELSQSYNELLDRLAAAMASQRQFVSAVSHELRNPLTLVSGYVRRTLRRGDNLNDAQRKGLKIAEEETNRTIRLIAQLLDLSRGHAGTLSVQIEPVRLSSELTEVINIARSSLKRPLNFVQPDSAIDRALCVQANSDRVRQVVMNLIENADKYSPPNTPIQVNLCRQGKMMKVAIVDQGIGIPQSDLDNIFERFYRASNATSVEGSGMGLAVVKLLVETMGGVIDVVSEVGQGTTFTLSFPLMHESTIVSIP